MLELLGPSQLASNLGLGILTFFQGSPTARIRSPRTGPVTPIESEKLLSILPLGSLGSRRTNLQLCRSSLKWPTKEQTPSPRGDTCLSYSNDEVDGHDLGTTQMTLFRSTYLRVVGKRLEKQLSTKVIFSDEELYAMQELCGFETTATGKSPWCDVFTKDEWLSFEYARDLLHFYRSGPGNKFGTVLGSLWVNATAQLLAEGPNAGPFFFSL